MNSTEQSPSLKANSLRLVENNPAIFGTPIFRYRIHKCPPSVPIVSQSNPVHASSSHFFKIHFNIITLSTPRSSKWSLSIRSSHHNPEHVSFVFHTSYMSRQFHPYLFDHPDIFVSSTDHKVPRYVVFSTPLLCCLS